MPATREIRHSDFGGLLLQCDPVHQAALAAVNFELPKPGILAKRGGIRRANHQRYGGAIVLIDDLQRICDYGKMLVMDIGVNLDDGGQVYEHGNGTGGTVVDLFSDPAYPPVAVAHGVPLTGLAPLTVSFSSVGSWDPNGGTLTYFWAFGDGATSNRANPTHQYTAGGNFTAILTVTNAAGKTASDTVPVVVTQPILLVRTIGPFRRSADGGTVWTTPAVAAGYGGQERFFRVGNDIIVVTWNQATWQFAKVFKSTDNGLNFSLIGSSPSIFGVTIQRVVVFTNPALPNYRRIVIAHTTVLGQLSCHYSDDDGATWPAETPIDANMWSAFNGPVPIARTPSGTLYCICYGMMTLPPFTIGPVSYRSTDGGATWTSLTNVGMPSWTVTHESLEPANDGSLLAYISNAVGNLRSIYRGVVVGATVTWTLVLSLPSTSWNGAANMLSNGSGEVLLLTSFREHYHSPDNGQTWNLIQTLTPFIGQTQGRINIHAHNNKWYSAGFTDRKVYSATGAGILSAQGADFHATTGGSGIMVVN